MSEKTKPALTPEEWGRRECLGPFRRGVAVRDQGELVEVDATMGWTRMHNPAGIAAIALQVAGPDGGPFFTGQDVDTLRSLGFEYDIDDERLADLADRIAALLPPGDATVARGAQRV